MADRITLFGEDDDALEVAFSVRERVGLDIERNLDRALEPRPKGKATGRFRLKPGERSRAFKPGQFVPAAYAKRYPNKVEQAVGRGRRRRKRIKSLTVNTIVVSPRDAQRLVRRRTRENVSRDEFWRVYHAMVRDILKRDSDVAILTTKIAAVV